MIQVRGVSKSYGPRVLWRDLSFDVEPGVVLALTGASGSGKSTLLNCIGLLERVDEGEIIVDGQVITGTGLRKARVLRRSKVGYLFQNYALIEDASVSDNLDIALQARRRSIRRSRYEPILERVGLAGRSKEKIFQLSGGEQQRVALARLMVKGPSVVLADEPTGALDSVNADMVIATLRDMADKGCTVIIATHSQAIEKSCDRTLRI